MTFPESTALFPNQIIRASAGTGKTFRLSNRYLRLLASGAECHTILATTFTKKGAGEILDRIVERLSSAALDSNLAKKLSDELEWKLPQARAADVLHDLLKNLHRLEVSTLDSFFNRVAKVFSLELGLPPVWEIVDIQQMNRLHQRAIETVLRDESVISLLHMISKGTVGRRVASLVSDLVQDQYQIFRESGPEPWDALKQTGKFLTEAQMESVLLQIEALVPPNKSLTNHWNDAIKPAAAAQDWIAFASTTSFQNFLDGNPKFSRANLPDEVIEIYETLRSHCTAMVEQQLIAQNHSTRDLLMAFGKVLEELKDVSGTLRFDDITQRLESFVEKWDAGQLAFRLDQQIQHLLLDEFQDTAISQWNVIRPFARSVTATPDSDRSFFCVGDLKQAIYGWRGGVAEIFDLVNDELPNLDDADTLTKSWRSAQPVIDLVNRVFLNLGDYDCDDPLVKQGMTEWADWYSEHSTARDDLAGYVAVEMAAEKAGSKDDGDELSANDQVLHKTVERIELLSNTLPPDKTIGVIVRTNNEVGQLIFELQAAGVPASEEGGNPVTDSAAVELVLSALVLADHPGDSLARFHLSHSPLADWLGLQPETDGNGFANGNAAVTAATRLREMWVIDGYGPTVEHLARMLMTRCTPRELVRLQQLVRVAYHASLENTDWQLRPKQFVDYVRDEVTVADQSAARVRVMTIHKAKGLEFDAVVLPFPSSKTGWAGMTPNVVIGRDGPTAPINIASRYAGSETRKLLTPEFQTMVEDDRRRNIRESMCVLYVALTRAAHAIHAIVPHGTKHDHKSTAALLISTLCPDAELVEGILYEHGDANWFQPKAAASTKSGRKKTSTTDEDPFQLQPFYLHDSARPRTGAISLAARSGRSTPRTSPSSLEGGRKIKLKNLFHSTQSEQAMERGEMIHACFELVGWLDQAIPTREQLETRLNRLSPSSAEIPPSIDDFFQMIDQPQIRQLLSRDKYQEMFLMQVPPADSILLEANRVEVLTERPFAVALDSGMLQGVIDRLVLVYEGDTLVAADVIDFKTDDVPSAAIQKRVEYYRPQLTAYRAAASKFLRLPLEKISTRMLFVQLGQLVNVE